MIGRLNLFGNNESAREAGPLTHARKQIAGQMKPTRPSTKALVGILLTHGARAFRSSQPKTLSRVKVCSPAGKAPVRIKLES
ncbi:hypothetical protein [Limoniibacter endophyticus]|uniref:Uncharacterized protein n=1 Tax=Limoniibacter endophyticus TaxID=1565040 RepID=A0A8J3DE40_9HYPH|nr:hypothetical protein [Limoniibacter endophyticus]GHC62206.1 hypothetical protein GCM10010136_03230 [Limoniibacter endophyticus]